MPYEKEFLVFGLLNVKNLTFYIFDENASNIFSLS